MGPRSLRAWASGRSNTQQALPAGSSWLRNSTLKIHIMLQNVMHVLNFLALCGNLKTYIVWTYSLECRNHYSVRLSSLSYKDTFGGTFLGHAFITSIF